MLFKLVIKRHLWQIMALSSSDHQDKAKLKKYNVHGALKSLLRD